MAEQCLPELVAKNATVEALNACFSSDYNALTTWAGKMTAFEKESTPFSTVPYFFIGSFDACKQDDGSFTPLDATSQTAESVRSAICAQHKALGGSGVEACQDDVSMRVSIQQPMQQPTQKPMQQPVTNTSDPVMPSNSSTANTSSVPTFQLADDSREE